MYIGDRGFAKNLRQFLHWFICLEIVYLPIAADRLPFPNVVPSPMTMNLIRSSPLINLLHFAAFATGDAHAISYRFPHTQ